MKTSSFVDSASELGAKVHGYFLSERTKTVQKDLLHASVIGFGGAVGIWSISSLSALSLPDEINQTQLIPVFLFLYIGYQLSLYVFSFWIDYRKYGFEKAKVVSEFKKLSDDAAQHFIRLQELADEAASEKKEEDIELQYQKLSNRWKEFKTEKELGNVKNAVLKDIAFGSSRIWKLTLILEFVVPVSLSTISLILVYVFAAGV
ncbi:MAG: hypothetical protein JAY94_07690 [Candidatus Thiodiazotropha endolucinida]|nr:hypothetical protein [Candidatus Thiodiazotropha taylori]MCW4317383.1 hypothetical protein [Candidatus Thiodiazotropha taylori]